MSAEPTRPTPAKPDWFVADSLKRVEPDGTRKTNGWNAGEPLPAQSENWLLYSISTWLTYLDAYVYTYLGVHFGAYARGYIEIAPETEYEIDATLHDGMVFKVSTLATLGNITLMILPDPEEFEGKKFTIVNVDGAADTNPIFLQRDGLEEIQGVASDYALYSPYGSWTVYCDGTDWWLI